MFDAQVANFVVVNLDNASVIARMKQNDIYDEFQAQLQRDDNACNLVVMSDKSVERNRADYYLFIRGFDDPKDNGCICISVIDPNDNPAIVEHVEQAILKQFTGAARVAYIGGGPRMN